jgi:transcription initiation factor TFIID subunit TAF12
MAGQRTGSRQLRGRLAAPAPVCEQVCSTSQRPTFSRAAVAVTQAVLTPSAPQQQQQQSQQQQQQQQSQPGSSSSSAAAKLPSTHLESSVKALEALKASAINREWI